MSAKNLKEGRLFFSIMAGIAAAGTFALTAIDPPLPTPLNLTTKIILGFSIAISMAIGTLVGMVAYHFYPATPKEYPPAS